MMYAVIILALTGKPELCLHLWSNQTEMMAIKKKFADGTIDDEVYLELEEK